MKPRTTAINGSPFRGEAASSNHNSTPPWRHHDAERFRCARAAAQTSAKLTVGIRLFKV